MSIKTGPVIAFICVLLSAPSQSFAQGLDSGDPLLLNRGHDPLSGIDWWETLWAPLIFIAGTCLAKAIAQWRKDERALAESLRNGFGGQRPLPSSPRYTGPKGPGQFTVG